MKSFFNFFQPTVVKSAELEDIPEALRGKYFVNLNIVGIKWFINNFLLIEDGNGGYLYMLTNNMHKIRLDEEWNQIIDIPRAYIVLTDEFVNSQEESSTWILSAISDNSYFATGTDNFKPGRDYYINTTLEKYLSDQERSAHDESGIINYTLHNYLSSDFEITKWWIDLSDTGARNNDFMWLLNKNKARDIGWTEEELDNVLHWFFKIISDGTSITDEDLLKTTNQIYRKVINYMMDGKSDCGTVAIQLILNTLTASYVEGVSTCNCTNTSNANNTFTNNALVSGFDTTTCLGKYQAAMEEWLQAMLGDKDFYKDWMYITNDDGSVYPDEGMIDMLIGLLEALLVSGKSLSFVEKPVYGNNCHCHDGSSSIDEINRKTIENYITLLEWVKTCCIDENTNKIKVIGKEFAKVITRL